ncbi:hypothetical protein C3781_09165 [Campylobacter jejuni]|nr:hypothetical protein [Campylobacter jejuni]EAJ5669102.1 hypothetical protein [Campylobacter jejuni]EAK4853442.1 hypothetical protein [Campylobacter jejuni]EAK4854200.1 hypothetical protein [Campylobacter jejuni]EAL9265209.1 hypothetical protein [Campylobacter jejuni]
MFWGYWSYLPSDRSIYHWVFFALFWVLIGGKSHENN